MNAISFQVVVRINVAGMSQEKLFDICRIFKFLKYYVIFILIFVLRKKTETANRAETAA